MPARTDEQLLVDFLPALREALPRSAGGRDDGARPGQPIAAGPDAPSTATRPQLTEAEADELYTIEDGASRRRRVHGKPTRAAAKRAQGGAGGAGGGPSGPLGERTVTYESRRLGSDGTHRRRDEDRPGLCRRSERRPHDGRDLPDDRSRPSPPPSTSRAARGSSSRSCRAPTAKRSSVPAKTSTPPMTLYGVDRDPRQDRDRRRALARRGAEERRARRLTVHASATFTNSLPQPFQAQKPHHRQQLRRGHLAGQSGRPDGRRPAHPGRQGAVRQRSHPRPSERPVREVDGAERGLARLLQELLTSKGTRT